MRRFKLEKLVRDTVNSGQKGLVFNKRKMEIKEFIEKLKDKLVEEAIEVKMAHTSDELVEEMGDLFEVMRTLVAAIGVTMEKVDDQRLKKREISGGFDGRYYAEFVDVEDDYDEIDYFLMQPDRYPEVSLCEAQSDL